MTEILLLIVSFLMVEMKQKSIYIGYRNHLLKDVRDADTSLRALFWLKIADIGKSLQWGKAMIQIMFNE